MASSPPEPATLSQAAQRGSQPTQDLEALIDLPTMLTDDERQIQLTVRRFAAERLAPCIAGWWDEGVLPRELAPQLAALGLLGMHLDGYGCAGANSVSYGLACMELEAIDSGLRSFVSVQGSLAMFAIREYGNEEQRRQWLPPMAAGKAIGCFGLTEPDHGSNPSAMRTQARRHGPDWVLNGTKMWITNGTIADVAVVWARTDDGIRGFVVPTDTPGFSASPIRRKQSLRASVTSELTFTDCRLPAAAMLEAAEGLSAPLSCLHEARFGVAWGVVGAARACLEIALRYARQRTQFDKPLAAFQLTQQKLADMFVEYEKATLLALHLARLKDGGQLPSHQISVAKLNNVREALSTARTARTILGAAGTTHDYPLMRHANNLESVLTYEGTSEIHTLSIGATLTGLRAFR